ncbi:tetracycline resistance protein, class H isoform X2 [Helianthus annuus]|uniref:tetracycline resistance protein, class H isoform X2 n=1 Tax=Helianthus annuus TaxID=4232 RepID=UPI000B8F15C7|nr:tetracycline resistance protein, class H isoform X2 [Helianthus annuus]
MPETNTTSWGLSHLFLTVFLFNFSHFMVIPAITDVSMAALCPGEDECSFAIYLTGVQQAADNVAEERRASAFGILSGISSCSFVTGNLLTRFLPSVASVFQVSAATAMVSVVYMRIFLPESNMTAAVIAVAPEKETTDECLLDNRRVSRAVPSLRDSFSLLKSSWTFSQAAIVAFFNMLGELGLMSALLYYLKAEFHFDKDQFADLMIIHGIAGIISQLILMPVLTRVINEVHLLAIGLAFSCIYIFLYSVAWSSWVVYLASTLQILSVFAGPSLRSIVSKQVGPTEQGKAQGCITGLCSFAGIISPLIFSPLTALFLSDHAPFHFPGFSLMCAAFTVMIAFIQSIMIKAPISNSKTDEYDPLQNPSYPCQP